MSLYVGGVTEMFNHFMHMRKRSWTPNGPDDADEIASAVLFQSHLYLCICFGLAQGATITTITYATTFMNESVGSYCDGIFFGAFTVTSMTIATPIVRHPRVGLGLSYKLAIACFIAYELLLWISYLGHETSFTHRLLAYFAALVGGFGFSLHWTSQSLIYQSTARQYAVVRKAQVETVNNAFSGVFACLYVLFEMLSKLAASFMIMMFDDPWFLFFLFFAAALCLSLYFSFHLIETTVHDRRVDRTRMSKLGYSTGGKLSDRSSIAALLLTNRNLLCLLPMSFAFGSTAGFLYSYYYDKTVDKYLGQSAVGFVSAVGPAACSLSSLPLSMIALRFGRGPIVVLGCLCFCVIGSMYLIWDSYQLGTWGTVLTINVLMGLGRAVWENTNKAIFADVFTSDEAPSAFACMYVVTGMITFLSLFVFPNISVHSMCVIVLVPSLLMVPGYMMVDRQIRAPTAQAGACTKDELASLYRATSDGEEEEEAAADGPANVVRI